MKIKGASILVVPKHIIKEFGKTEYHKWLNNISQEARDVYSKKIRPIDWFDLKKIYLDPVNVMCKMFYKGDYQGAWDVGAMDARNALSGFYRIFIKLGSPEFLIKRSSVVFPTYYQGASMEIIELEKGKSVLRITDFCGESMQEINKYTIKGWMIAALNISGAKNVNIEVTSFKQNNEGYTDFVLTWE